MTKRTDWTDEGISFWEALIKYGALDGVYFDNIVFIDIDNHLARPVLTSPRLVVNRGRSVCE